VTVATTTGEVAADLRVVVARLARRLRAASGDGLSPSQLSALAHIDECGPMRLTDLAAKEAVSAPTMSKIVDALAAQRLLVRATDPGDARSSLITLTVDGRRELADLRRSRTALLAAALDRLDAADLARVRAVLPVLRVLADEVADGAGR
jgi:DNA-binding MarR family transcriptional regulator